MTEIERLTVKAREILEKNWMGRYTRPSPLLYPHQWSWDSGFIAIGKSAYDQLRAQEELETLFEAQWKNGMVPQIVFNPEVTGDYFPDIGFWGTKLADKAPLDRLTSGITQPPVHAIAANYIYKRATDKAAALDFLTRLYPKLLRYHRFFYEERDPDKNGLVYIRHPWESGADNSPAWDQPLSRIPTEQVPKYERRDLDKGVSAEQRPTDRDYDHYIYLVDLFKNHRYDEALIYEVCPFLVEDVLVNSILVRANEELAEIATELGEDHALIDNWIEKTKSAMNEKLWHKDHGFYDDFDAKADQMIEIDTAAAFVSLYAGVPTKQQAERLYDFLDSKSFCSMHQKKCFSIPNYNMEGEYFNPANYWRGPIWININWMLFQGLERYGYKEKALSVRRDIIELVKRNGFYEYFDPIKGSGYGSADFSWSAALFLDCIYQERGPEAFQ